MREKLAKVVANFTWVDWLLVGLLCAGLIYLVLFSLSLWTGPRRSVEFIASGDLGGQFSGGEEIWVDVSGAVTTPGVYQLAPGARTKDALVAAGGLTAAADREFVEKTINLAQKVKDGDKIYIPVSGQGGEDRTETRTVFGQGLVNLNKASLSDLMSLSGIGEVRARAIVENRPYAAVDELTAKKVVSQSVFEKIKDKVAVY